MVPRRNWTSDEDKILRRFYRNEPVQDTAQRISRNKNQVIGRARILGLHRPSNRPVLSDGPQPPRPSAPAIALRPREVPPEIRAMAAQFLEWREMRDAA